MTMPGPIRVLHITDSHLLEGRDDTFLGINTYHSYLRVVHEMQAESHLIKPQLIIFSGDISQEDSQQSYHRAWEGMKDFDCPVIWTSGNHDNPAYAIECLSRDPMRFEKKIDFNAWRIIILNSHWEGHILGKLTKNELTLLDRLLKTAKDHPVMIFLHHPILPVGNQWLDKLGLINADRFLAVIDHYRCVKAVVCGHVHQENMIYRNQVCFMTSPSTAYQFMPMRDKFTLDTAMPGFRWFDLLEDGSFMTQVIRIPYDPQFVPNLKSKGY